MADRKRNNETREDLRNEDPITGEPGSHPTGSGVGAAAGGAATGAAAGALVGPAGAAAGAVVGGLAGGLAGKAIAENIDPTVEAAYWEKNYRGRDYVDSDVDYHHYEPAYRYGWESRTRYDHDDFGTAEKDLERDWEKYRGNSILEWGAARPATEDAWNRATTEYGRKRPCRSIPLKFWPTELCELI